jgi:hypothetical protein
VLIALEATHLAGGLDLPDEASWQKSVTLELAPAEPIHVRVVDEHDKPIAGARVRHMACVEQPSTSEDFTRTRFRRFLMDEGETAADGGRALVNFGGEQAFWAELGELVSLPWQGNNPRSVELRLEASFTVGGTLALPSWAPTYRGERRILLSGLTGNLWRPLARLRGVEAGEWGPIRVPATGFARCRLRLEGSPIVPQEFEFQTPRPGTHRNFDLVAEKGSELWFAVQEAGEKPIPSARAELWWDDPHAPRGTGRVEFGAFPDGRINAWSFPPGTVNYRITAPGFTSYESLEIVPSPDEKLALEIVLAKCGAITGRCLREGVPVPDFEVHTYRNGPVHAVRSRTFLGRADGSFTLDAVTPGTWAVFAASPHCSCSPSVTVEVGEGDARVELELPPAVRGVGQVVDAKSGESLSEASLQLYVDGADRTVPWGTPFPVARDGSFDLEVFTPGHNFITVSCDGYASRRVEATCTDELLDWGSIELQRPQPLRVRLLQPETLGDVRANELVVSGTPIYPLPATHFVDGVATFEAVAPGNAQVLVSESSTDFLRLSLDLLPGAEWDFDCAMSGPRRLDVFVEPPDGTTLDYVPGVMLFATEKNGFVLRSRLTNDGVARFGGIRSDRVQVQVYDFELQIVATTDVAFGSEESKEVVVRLGEKPVRVHVIDKKGSAIPAVWVTARGSNGAHIYGVNQTDAEGWAKLLGLPPSTVLLDLEHPTAGRRQGVSVDASRGDIEVELEAEGSIQLRLVDDGVRLAEVQTWLEATDGVRLSRPLPTGPDGVVRYEPVGPGTYRFACQRADCWPTSIDITMTEETQVGRDVPLRRLSDVTLTVVDPEGRPISGLPVALVPFGFECDVSAWIDAGRVRAPKGTSTDAQGELRLEGLPHGEYGWSAASSEGDRTGRFVLEPGPNVCRVQL